MDKPIVVFISGLSGTGKSTLVKYFYNNPIPDWIFYDFDKGRYKIPKDNNKHLAWRRRQTDWWLKEAYRESTKNNLHVGILGLALYPQDTLELASAKLFGKDNIYFALMHCDAEERKKRLFQRGTPQHWRGHQAWYDEFYGKMKAVNAPIFDTTNKSIEDIAQEIKKWIELV